MAYTDSDNFKAKTEKAGMSMFSKHVNFVRALGEITEARVIDAATDLPERSLSPDQVARMFEGDFDVAAPRSEG